MCGICGEIRFDDTPVSPERLDRMSHAMRARGPDDHGLIVHRNRGFAHRRLMVMDLSGASAQPMFDPELGLGIVFNGAVYNYPDLREELREAGYRFWSDGDTEVVLKAWHRWGAGCPERLEGMFAFAVWNRDSGETALVRDRLGIKPLYYTADSRRLRFASSLPALLAAGEVSGEVDPLAVTNRMVRLGTPDDLQTRAGAFMGSGAGVGNTVSGGAGAPASNSSGNTGSFGGEAVPNSVLERWQPRRVRQTLLVIELGSGDEASFPGLDHTPEIFPASPSDPDSSEPEN
jgi:asparagine synthetase B (glutamine-hydrolysing)